jgi:hypothetical protein
VSPGGEDVLALALTPPTVVLGADHPLALPLLLDFESEGYIVIASADSAEACQEIESRCHGYVRVLPLDPSDVGTLLSYLPVLC